MHIKTIQLLALAMASQQAGAEINANSFVENLNKLSELSSSTNDMVGKFQVDTVGNEAPVRLKVDAVTRTHFSDNSLVESH